jgi:hypothetical protein
MNGLDVNPMHSGREPETTVRLRLQVLNLRFNCIGDEVSAVHLPFQIESRV